MLLWFLWSGNGHTSRQHSFRYTLHLKYIQYLKVSALVSNVLYMWMTFSYAADLDISTSLNDTFGNASTSYQTGPIPMVSNFLPPKLYACISADFINNIQSLYSSWMVQYSHSCRRGNRKFLGMIIDHKLSFLPHLKHSHNELTTFWST